MVRTFLNVRLSFLLLILVSPGCISKTPITLRPLAPESLQPLAKEIGLPYMGYTIQVGAFSRVENAVRLTKSLKRQGVDAYYFVYDTGTYKVVFGDFPSEKLTREKAENLKSQGIIEEFFIVSPSDYTVSKIKKYGFLYLRDELIHTAEKFIGAPYLWGGSSLEEGFDCSGLTKVVYQLNGLNLPRSSRDQFEAGIPVQKDRLSRGDLVFFNTKSPEKVSHVGIYMGDGKFIHAPGWGKKIVIGTLSNGYFQKRYAGARSYFSG